MIEGSGSDPDPYLYDPDPRDPKTYGSDRSDPQHGYEGSAISTVLRIMSALQALHNPDTDKLGDWQTGFSPAFDSRSKA